MESLFHIAFWLIFGAMLGMQIYFSYRFRLVTENKPYDGMELRREEGWPTIVRVVRSATLVVFLILYTLDHRLLKPLTFPLFNWMRIIGVALGILSLVLYSWARSTIGRAWSSQLRVQGNHQLITMGPYRWVRHPIYLALILFMISISLIAANWILIGFLLISFMDLMLRIPKEEQMLRERFGEDYEAYIGHTGKLLPK